MTKATRDEAYRAIDTERAYQQRIWGAGCVPDIKDNSLSVGDFILLIEEYAARARAEWSGQASPETAALHTMRKIAGIAVNCMEQHGAYPRPGEVIWDKDDNNGC